MCKTFYGVAESTGGGKEIVWVVSFGCIIVWGEAEVSYSSNLLLSDNYKIIYEKILSGVRRETEGHHKGNRMQ